MPKKPNSKRHRISLRLDESHFSKLNELIEGYKPEYPELNTNNMIENLVDCGHKNMILKQRRKEKQNA